MSYPCCEMCVYWLYELKECGNTHIEKCVNHEHFKKASRNCYACEQEIYNEAIDDFASELEKLIKAAKYDFRQIRNRE